MPLVGDPGDGRRDRRKRMPKWPKRLDVSCSKHCKLDITSDSWSPLMSKSLMSTSSMTQSLKTGRLRLFFTRSKESPTRCFRPSRCTLIRGAKKRQAGLKADLGLTTTRSSRRQTAAPQSFLANTRPAGLRNKTAFAAARSNAPTDREVPGYCECASSKGLPDLENEDCLL